MSDVQGGVLPLPSLGLCLFFSKLLQELAAFNPLLKGHGNEADFLEFLQKLVPHRSLTLSFEPFRFWLRIRGDIRNRKTTPRPGESATLRLGESGSRYSNFFKFSIDI
jgi:hypothetical protein